MYEVRDVVIDYFDRKEPDYQNSNPHTAISAGAAIQGALINGEIEGLFLDFVSVDVGIRAYGNHMHSVILRNDPMPCKAAVICKTTRDNQTSMNFHIIQGDERFAAKNDFIGEFRLDGIPPKPKGHWPVKVKFVIFMDANGVLSVSAKLKVDEDKILEQSLTKAASVEKDDLKRIMEGETKALAASANAKSRLAVLAKYESQFTAAQIQLNDSKNSAELVAM